MSRTAEQEATLRARYAERARLRRNGVQLERSHYRRGDEKDRLLVVCWCESEFGEVDKTLVARGETFSCGAVGCKDQRLVPVPAPGWV